jgi:hypothetical protein
MVSCQYHFEPDGPGWLFVTPKCMNFYVCTITRSDRSLQKAGLDTLHLCQCVRVPYIPLQQGCHLDWLSHRARTSFIELVDRSEFERRSARPPWCTISLAMFWLRSTEKVSWRLNEK